MNAAFHGKLINDFKIPGSDTQKATDLITAKFGAEKGAALRVVARLERPAARLACGRSDRRADARRRPGVQRDLAEHPKDLQKITSPLSDKDQLSDNGRVAFFDVQYDRNSFQLPRSGIVALEDQLRAIGDPRRRAGRVHR